MPDLEQDPDFTMVEPKVQLKHDKKVHYTGVTAASEISPQMTDFQAFYRATFYFLLAAQK